MVDFFDEVAQDVKQEKFRKLFEKYGNLLVSFLLLIIFSTGIGVWYKNHKHERAIESGDLFFEASELALAQKKDLADGKLQEVIKDGSDGYKELAMLQMAQNLEKKNDLQGAAKLYGEVEKSGADHTLADMAALHHIFLQMENPDLIKDNADMDAALEKLSDTSRPWRYTALELQGMLAIKNNNTEKARTIFKTLQEDALSPRSIRERAAIMLSKLPKA